MTLQLCNINLDAFEKLEIALDDKNLEYYVTFRSLEKALDWRADSAREKIKSKSLETFLGKALTLGKKKAPHGGFLSLLSVKDFSLLMMHEAIQGNVYAQAILVATNMEAIERRADAALGIERSEDYREAKLWKEVRQLARERFEPKLTDWLQKDGAVNGDYGRLINEFKRALNLPQESIDEYTDEDMKTWQSGLDQYDILRAIGLTHVCALGNMAKRLKGKDLNLD